MAFDNHLYYFLTVILIFVLSKFDVRAGGERSSRGLCGQRWDGLVATFCGELFLKNLQIEKKFNKQLAPEKLHTHTPKRKGSSSKASIFQG